ncbi:hypothetical protein SDRG_02028 [Saprolegnia diclina VS20]|uniref:Magnesium transporter n=1 Tax=Saprolegnia diclina (strain VS20) TaxID=1156394 RepID=T0R3S7_SAPDV|nr:hypothetical protein SDRG_02028 [Saprolegnia diclina VS20]EQC40965.1 hypothetical protein SDRG_02028 [Saprolegnia diclina VS20]|eukprot:XP_008605809.1 hypothetical protein SDRG_02028 [Saprolegnia diclina VS20]
MSSTNLGLGIGMCLVGTTVSNLGLNIQKYSFLHQERLPETQRRPYNTQWRWWLGFACVGLGSIADFAALTFAAQSVITPIGAFTLVANLGFAHYWLKEPLGSTDLAGTGLIVLGATAVTIFGSHESPKYSLDELIALSTRGSMVVYAIAILGLVAFFHVVRMRSEQVLRKCGKASPEYRALEKLHPLSYAGFAGIVGAQSVMFAKSSGELIQLSLQGRNQFNRVLTYVILAGLVLTISVQTHMLALGLKNFDALYMVPVFTCFFISFSVLGGAVYFNEFQAFTLYQWICFPLGVAITVVGVILLSRREMRLSETTLDGMASPGTESQEFALATTPRAYVAIAVPPCSVPLSTGSPY